MESFRVRSSPVLLIIAGSILFITGTFFSVDWLNYLSGTGSIYPALAKPFVSLLCALIAFGTLRSGLSRTDARMLVIAYACIIVVDITMSIYVYADPTPLTTVAFLIGAALSIAAHVLLILRHARGFTFLRSTGPASKKSYIYRFGFPLAFYLPVVALFIFLSPWLNRVNQFWPSLFYTVVLATSLWIAWETVRQKLFPRPNALLIAWGVTFWFLTELVGVVHNIEVGALSEIAVNVTWLFYMPAILLLAFSGYRFTSD